MNDLKVDEKKLLELLQDLIRIESINPKLAKQGSGEIKIANYIGKYLKKLGIEVKFQDVDEKRKNVIGLLKGNGKGRSLMLNGHTDTVSIHGMEIEPFNPQYKKGRVYGRGALDMKCGLAAMIIAVKSIIESEIKLNGDLILAFVADEEYASLGTERLIKEYFADAAIVCEPSYLQIVIAHKGFAWIKIGVNGKAAHGSLPGFGIDAIVKAGKFLVKVEDLEKNILSKKKHPLVGLPSIHASLINGGIEISTYPDFCEIQLERRTLPGEDREFVIEEIKNLINKLSLEDNKFNAEFDVFFYRSALEVSENEPIVNSLIKAYQKNIKHEFKLGGFSGWTDASLLNDAGIPTILFGPKGIGAHGSIEYVDFKSVVMTTKVLIDTIINFCGA